MLYPELVLALESLCCRIFSFLFLDNITLECFNNLLFKSVPGWRVNEYSGNDRRASR